MVVQGTLRSNLDPFGTKDDATLWDALRRSWLVGERQVQGLSSDDGGYGSPEDATNSSRFHLDMTIDDEGRNLSVGERSLVSLARALVKDVSRVAKKRLPGNKADG
jgi:ABC-type multidrug transport system fused ATPase/permease subunit